MYNGGNKEDILDLFFQARRGTISPEMFEPHIEVLPAGVYPGQKLYYLHVEAIGLGDYFEKRHYWLQIKFLSLKNNHLLVIWILLNRNKAKKLG